MWFLGFPISMILGGLFTAIGPKRIMQFAFSYNWNYFSYILWWLCRFNCSYGLIGIGNGCTEAACNPTIADSYTGKRMNTLMNRFHIWFPGGIVLGTVSLFLLILSLGWEVQMWYIIIPTVIYAYLFYGQRVPKPRISGDAAIVKNLKGLFFSCFHFY